MGQPARGKGGTAEIVEHARAIGRPLIIIDALTGQRRTERALLQEVIEWHSLANFTEAGQAGMRMEEGCRHRAFTRMALPPAPPSR